MKAYYYEDAEGKVKVINAKSDPSAYLPDGATLLNELDRSNMPDTARKDLWTNDGSGNAEVKAADLTDAERAEKLQAIRDCRDAKYKKADTELLKHSDADPNAIATEAEWKTYRIALRDATDPYKDGNGDPIAAVDAINDAEADVSWPTEPTDA